MNQNQPSKETPSFLRKFFYNARLIFFVIFVLIQLLYAILALISHSTYSKGANVMSRIPSERFLHQSKVSLNRATFKSTDYSGSMFAQPWLLYDFLGVPITATPKEIKGAYYKVAKELHPDKWVLEAKEKEEYFTNAFKIVSKSKSILSDQKKRCLYDHWSNVYDKNGHADFRRKMEMLSNTGVL